ncbi:hypothetical protein QFC24_001660 [Naganishia onofrii]|uniref:Uncharacterized protein n=1 Tax=Naganishia onofrii TaxID=1851511 RepID=A0ACC2XTB7_9TREE|nr:hypothetical protein QFC24_001660 [Naganishia onofrii]
MSALSEKEKLQREIAKLSATIKRSSSNSAPHTYPVKSKHVPTPYPRKPYAAASSSRHHPAQLAGGRHRSLVLDNRNGQSAASSTITPKTLTDPSASNGGPASIVKGPNGAAVTDSSLQYTTTRGTSASTATQAPLASISSTAAGDTKMAYVNRTTKKGNMSMVKPELYGKLQVS